MGLKLTVKKGDKILVGDDVVINILSPGAGKKIQFEFDAPQDVKIHTIFLDPNEQFKKRQKGKV